MKSEKDINKIKNVFETEVFPLLEKATKEAERFNTSLEEMSRKYIQKAEAVELTSKRIIVILIIIFIVVALLLSLIYYIFYHRIYR